MFVLSLFSFPGYRRLRMHNKGGSPVAFVEFEVGVSDLALPETLLAATVYTRLCA